MKVLTDCPDALQEWGLGNLQPARFETASPIWDTFGGGADGWACETDDHPGIQLVVIERTNVSQFDQLIELARSGTDLADTLVCLALEGENFHGQSARPWAAHRGNLHLSCISKLGLPAADLREAISILPTLALLDAFEIEANPAAHTGIRWLNDLFVRGKKLAGTIAATQLDGDQIESVIYGIGVNVDVVPAMKPTPFVRAATSLNSAMPNAGWTVAKAALALVKSLETRIKELRMNQCDQLTEIYARNSACIGQRVRVWPRDTTDFVASRPLAIGELEAIHRDLSLNVAGARGRVRDGRLAFEEDCLALGL